MKTSGRTKISDSPVFDAEGYQANLADLNRTRLPDLKRAKSRPFGWGGARPGAGRQASGRQPVLLRLTPKTLRALRAAAKRQGKTLSDFAEDQLAAV